MDKILKENLKTSVHINKEEQNEIFRSLFTNRTTAEKSIKSSLLFNLFNLLNMHIQKSRWLYLGLFVFLLGVASTSFVLYPNKTNLNLSFWKQEKEATPNYLAKLAVQKGEVSIIRGNETLKVSNESDLLFNDEILVSGDGLAVINADWGSVALGGNSEVKVLNEAGLYVKKGKLLANSGDNVISLMSNQTIVKVNGTVLAQMSEQTTARKNSVYAADNNTFLTVIVVDGKATIIKDNKEVVVDSGKKVVVTNKVEKPEAVKKDDVNEDFVKKSAKLVKTESPLVTDYTAPVLTIKSPKDGATVNSDSVKIVFSSNEDGWYLKNDKWVNLGANKDVSITQKLKEGANKITVVIKDIAYNKSSKTITVNYVIPVKISWSSKPVGRSDGVYMAWKSEGLKTGDYIKVFRNNVLYKAFVVNENNKYSAWFLDNATKKGVTYKYHITIRRNGKYIAQTSDVAVVAQTYEPPKTEVCKVSLWRIDNTSYIVPVQNDYNVQWSVSGDCGEYIGYKLVWNTSGNPVYPGDNYHYYGNINTHKGIVPSGTWYVRVGLYRPDHTVQVYSNQLYGTF